MKDYNQPEEAMNCVFNGGKLSRYDTATLREAAKLSDELGLDEVNTAILMATEAKGIEVVKKICAYGASVFSIF